MTALRTFAIIFIFCCTAIAWVILGGSVQLRTDKAKNEGADAVGELWGTEQRQRAPSFYYTVTKEVEVEAEPAPATPEGGATPAPARGEGEAGKPKKKIVTEAVYVNPETTRVNVGLKLDYRRKGLLWFSTYTADFSGTYRLRNTTPERRKFYCLFNFPATNALYDSFVFKIQGRDVDFPANIAQGVAAEVELGPGEATDVVIGYRSPGLDRWVYQFGEGVTRVRDFTLTAHTDFAKIDFPTGCISPTREAHEKNGWLLTWEYKDLLTGYQVGVEMPKKLNPGPIASRMSYFAPVSLLFFFTVLFIISAVKTDRYKPIHPMNFFFLGAAFFAFHLLFAYLADHFDINLTFAISALASCALVFVYVALARNARYSVAYATLPQIAFLVLFSYAFFYPGYTGLIITVGAVLTLAVLMWATARVDWASRFGVKKEPAGPPAPAG